MLRVVRMVFMPQPVTSPVPLVSSFWNRNIQQTQVGNLLKTVRTCYSNLLQRNVHQCIGLPGLTLKATWTQRIQLGFWNIDDSEKKLGLNLLRCRFCIAKCLDLDLLYIFHLNRFERKQLPFWWHVWIYLNSSEIGNLLQTFIWA